MNKERIQPKRVRLRRRPRLRDAQRKETSPSKLLERAQKALLRTLETSGKSDWNLETTDGALKGQPLTDLQIQDEEVSRSIVFRPLIDQNSGAFLFDGVEKHQDWQWKPHLSGPLQLPSSSMDQNTPEPCKLADNHCSYVRGPFTDSGYASALGTIAMPRAPLQTSSDVKDEDNRTTYTGGSSIGELQKNGHVQELANEIYFHLELEEHRQSWEAISSHVATIIKAFAMRAGSFFGTQASKTMMRFVHKHSMEIVTAIDTLLASDDNQAEVQINSPGAMSLSEKIALWVDKEQNFADEAERDDLFDGVAGDDDWGPDETVSWSYRNLLFGSPPYEWLMATLRREIRTSGASPESKIRNRILEALPCGEVSRHRPLRTHNVTFEVPWEAIMEAGRGSGLSYAEVRIDDGRSGHGSQPCVSTVLSYARKRWPSCGEQVLSVIDQLLATKNGSRWVRGSWVTAPDSTTLSAMIAGKALLVSVSGLLYSIAECGEQLAWLVLSLAGPSSDRHTPPVPYLVGEDFGLTDLSPRGSIPIRIRLGGQQLRSNPEQYAEPERGHERRDSDEPVSPQKAGDIDFDRSPSDALKIPSSSMATTISADESLDSDMLSISDRSEHLTPFCQDPIVSAVFNEVLHKLLEDWQTNNRCQPSTEKSSQSSGVPHTGSSLTQAPSSQTEASQKRRLRSSEENSDGFGDDDNESPRPRKKATNGSQPRKFFACPFWKKNPRAHRDCFSYKLSRIKDVKQHLARQHTPIHCERCLKVFRDRHTKWSHFESDEPCSRGLHGELDGITNEQSEDLRKKSKRGQTESEQWFAVWQVLFPAISRPDSPYMDFEQSQEFAEWEDFCQRRGSAVVAEELSRHLWGESGLPEWVPDLLRIAQSGFRAAFEEFRSQGGSSVPSSEVYDTVGNWLGLGEDAFRVHGHGQAESETYGNQTQGRSFPLQPVVEADTTPGAEDNTDEHLDVTDKNPVELQHFGEWLDWDANFH
ncbi:hypothetical protein B0T16DRAFT_408654 [Cercophora newfieldiana]|uniref:C2H2-type domain-containing protein n=1 Tax=Cercophora newfieldiana TaxID=92897 RepID=A0AA39YAG3_9PEZI|nr:hypothetical protein B0T16DRAFT_408654 [Cercophora newfieldiana]